MSEQATIKYIQAPLTAETIKDLHAGDVVRISGYIYTARDAAHKRLYEALGRGEKLPLDLKDNVIYYVGPTPAKPGEVVGSAGPTTSGRMDKYTPTMIEQGMRGMIGKGLRSQVGTMFGTLAKGVRYLEMAEGYCTRMALDENNEVIGYEFLHLGKFTEALKKGKTPEEAIEAAKGHYGRFDDAAKYIDPRKE